MYPPLESPTSPQDEPMTDLNILNNPSIQDIHNPPKIPIESQVKSSDTLRNNIDLKNETTKKRTSMNIENGCMDTVNEGDIITAACNGAPDKIKFKAKRNSKALDNVAHHGDNNNRDSSASSSADEKVIRNCVTLSDVDNRKVRRVVRTRTNHRIDNDVRDDDDDDDDYNDMENGNSTDSSQKRDSMTSKEESSSDDYFLCEKFKNTLNAQLTDAVQAELNASGEPMELLSPQEVEMGRRYAEVSQFKNNKW